MDEQRDSNRWLKHCARLNTLRLFLDTVVKAEERRAAPMKRDALNPNS